MFDFLNHNSVGFDVKKNQLIARAQTIPDLRALQLLDVTVQSRFEARNLANDLSRKALWERAQTFKCLLGVFDFHRQQVVTDSRHHQARLFAK